MNANLYRHLLHKARGDGRENRSGLMRGWAILRLQQPYLGVGLTQSGYQLAGSLGSNQQP